MLRVAIICFLLSPLMAFARICPAEVQMTVAEEAKVAEAIVVGQMIAEHYSKAGPGQPWVDGTFYTVAVRQVLAGKPTKNVRLFSENSSGRFPLKNGVPYLLFVSSCHGQHFIDAKGNSAPLRESQATLKALRAKQPNH